MIILIGNKKGGIGKTTLAMLLAWYLSYLRGMTVKVIDMDERQSISMIAAKDSILENEPLYEVIECQTAYYNALLGMLTKEGKSTLIVDLPSSSDEEAYLQVLKSAAIILCPFAYDEFSMDSTLLFALICRKLNPEAKIIFIPNRLKAGANYQVRVEADAVLRTIGQLCPGIPERIDFQRLTTLYLPESLRATIEPLLDLLFTHYLFPQHSLSGK